MTVAMNSDNSDASEWYRRCDIEVFDRSIYQHNQPYVATLDNSVLLLCIDCMCVHGLAYLVAYLVAYSIVIKYYFMLFHLSTSDSQMHGFIWDEILGWKKKDY